MNKEKITLEAIKQDLLKVVNLHLSNKLHWLFSAVIPMTLLAIILCILLHNIFIILMVLLIIAYYIARHTIKYCKFKKAKKAVLTLTKREKISISTETFSHIASQDIYEPHKPGHRVHTTKNVTFYYFDSGSSWRSPTNFGKYYSWSDEFCISAKGLENISIAGDKFYMIGLQNHPDISYIYPCKFFELDENLEK